VQADVKMLLSIRGLTNSGLKASGEQPAFLGSEIKRLETALASSRASDAAKLAQAREALARLHVEKKVYDALENSAVGRDEKADYGCGYHFMRLPLTWPVLLR
jgi:hypothetical protein